MTLLPQPSAPPSEALFKDKFEAMALDYTTPVQDFKLCFKNGVPVDFYTEKMGATLFSLKVWYGNLSEAAKLLILGADILAKNWFGENILEVLIDSTNIGDQRDRLEWFMYLIDEKNIGDSFSLKSMVDRANSIGRYDLAEIIGRYKYGMGLAKAFTKVPNVKQFRMDLAGPTDRPITPEQLLQKTNKLKSKVYEAMRR